MRIIFTKQLVVGIITVLSLLGAVLLPVSQANAVDCAETPNAPSCAIIKGTNAAGANNDTSCGSDGTAQCSIGDRVKQVVNILLFVVGTVSVIMIILGGIRYTLSNGDPSQIKSAKDTILYAVIGLIVALLAYAIINFVVTQFT